MGPMGYPLTSATTSKKQKERGFHSHSSGRLKSRTNRCTLLITERSYFSFVPNGKQPTKISAVINKITIIIFLIHSCLASFKKNTSYWPNTSYPLFCYKLHHYVVLLLLLLLLLWVNVDAGLQRHHICIFNCVPTCYRHSSLTAWPLNMWPIDCPETPVTEYQSTPRHTPIQRRVQTNCPCMKFLLPFSTASEWPIVQYVSSIHLYWSLIFMH
jgi:hypothetical protein